MSDSWEEKTRKLYKADLDKAQGEFMRCTLALMSKTAHEPDKTKEYPKWENWKVELERMKKSLSRATFLLNKYYIRLLAFEEVEQEHRYKEQTLKKVGR